MAALTFGACAYRAQVIRLNPMLSEVVKDAEPSAAARDVVIVTQDARPIREIGRRAGATPEVATITTDTDVAKLLEERMMNILAAKGFRAVLLGPATVPSLRVALTELSYASYDQGGARKIKVQAVLEATTKNKNTTYRKSFQANQERKIVVEPVAKSNEEWINETFTDALQQLINDEKIYSSLK